MASLHGLAIDKEGCIISYPGQNCITEGDCVSAYPMVELLHGNGKGIRKLPSEEDVLGVILIKPGVKRLEADAPL